MASRWNRHPLAGFSSNAVSWLLRFIVSLLLVIGSSVAADLTEEAESLLDRYAIEGKVIPPDVATPQWLSSTRVIVNGGQHLAFLKHDGSFMVSNLQPGSYVVEIANPNYMYEPARVDINSKGKFRARRVNFIQSSLVQHMPYPLKLKTKGPFKYFQVRETWRITDFLLNPMVLMMVLPLLLIMVLPKMMNTADPETQRDLQQMQMPKYDMPELSEMMTSLFTGGKQPQVKSGKASKKRQLQ